MTTNLIILFLMSGLAACAAHQSATEDDLEVQLRSHRREIQNCYDQQVALNGLIDEGTIRLQVQQKADGSIVKIEEVGGFPGSLAVSGCISKLIKSWPLQKPSGETTFNVRWSFIKRECLKTNSCPPDDAEKPYADEVLDQIMGSKGREFQACSENFNPSTEDQNRRISIAFKVSPEGSVTNVENQSPSEENRSAFGCVASLVQSLQFPPRPAGSAPATIQWSWLFPVQKWEVVR